MSFASSIKDFAYYERRAGGRKKNSGMAAEVCTSLAIARNGRVSSNNTNSHVSKSHTTSAKSYLNAMR